MEVLHDELKKRRREQALKSAKETALTAGEWGAAYGLLDNVLYGAKSWKQALGQGLGYGALSALAGGGSSLASDALLPEADPSDATAYTKRGAVGGALGGGALGAAGGALLGSGRLSGLRHAPGAAAMAGLAKERGLFNNLITDAVKSRMKRPGAGGALALGLGGLGAIVGGMQGASAGMDRDILSRLSDEENNQ